jgi:hypothetical protein
VAVVAVVAEVAEVAVEALPVTLPVKLPTKAVAVNMPVDGTKLNFEVVNFAAVFPAAVVHKGYTDIAVAASSVEFTGTVIATEPSKFIPLIALGVANVVAVLALPVSAPVNEVDATDVNPARVVDEPPRLIAVVPIVRLLLVNAPFGILVKPAPDPANPVAVKIPVLGTNFNFVVESFAAILPAAVVHNG